MFFSLASQYCVVIEYGWYKKMLETSLYVYEFNSSKFYPQDTFAGYYVSTQTEKPISEIKIDNLFEELFLRNAEVRIINNLWPLADRVKHSTLNWSLRRMRNAKLCEQNEFLQFKKLCHVFFHLHRDVKQRVF